MIDHGVMCLRVSPKAAGYLFQHFGGSSSVAERQLPKLNVAGSIPVSRSNVSSR